MTGRIALIGFGEAGSAFAGGWLDGPLAGTDAPPAAYDIKTDDPATAPGKRRDYEVAGIRGSVSAAEALDGAVLVFSLVTADASLAVAEDAATKLAPGALYFDCNSVAPSTKRKAAEAIDAVDARYVDTAVMAPVHPKRHKTPILLSGDHAEAGAEALRALDMDVGIVRGPVGAASSIKMVRSIMIKGLEALTAECLLAGRKAGVEEAVLDTLEKSFPDFGWRSRVGYNLERMLTHGGRRAAEMEEVAKTVADLGLEPRMSGATVGWQRQLGALGLAAADSYSETADRILEAFDKQPETSR